MRWHDDRDALDAVIGALPQVAPDAHDAERIRQRCRAELTQAARGGYVGTLLGWLRWTVGGVGLVNSVRWGPTRASGRDQ